MEAQVTIDAETRRLLVIAITMDADGGGALAAAFRQLDRGETLQLLDDARKYVRMLDDLDWSESGSDEPVVLDRELWWPWLREKQDEFEACLGSTVATLRQQERGEEGSYTARTQEESIRDIRELIERQHLAIERLVALQAQFPRETAVV